MSNVSYTNLDTIILRSNLKWEDIAECYKTECKTVELNHGYKLEAHNLLYYIRGLSRVILDHEFSEWNKKYGNKLTLIAAGSTNITSDYDVTIVGNTAISFVRQVLFKMKRVMKNVHLAEFADTNMYVLPSVYKPKKNLPTWLSLAPINKSGMLCPLPKSDVAKAIERHYMQELWKKGSVQGVGFNKMYERLLKLATPLEKLYYDPKYNNMDEPTYWHALYSATKYSIEAYLSMSAFMVVVIEMQSKFHVSQLDDFHYEMAVVDNIVALKDHHILTSTFKVPKKIDEMKLLKASKYIQRITYALSKNKELSKHKNVVELLKKNSLIDFVVHMRGVPTIIKDERFSQFMKLIQTQLQLVVSLIKTRLFSQ